MSNIPRMVRYCIPSMKSEMPKLHSADVLAGCGHWTQQERPDEVNARLLPWLKSL